MSLHQDLANQGLTILATCAPEPTDDLPDDIRQLALIGPDEPNFWQVFSTSAEYLDGHVDPMNRWSERVANAIAQKYNADALFPFGGPPWHPFISWALRSGTCFESPVSLLVHAHRGLFISFRVAFALRDPEKDVQGPNPCKTCSAPCITACPVGALDGSGYDVPACTVHIATEEGRDCMQGCKVRRACPIGQHRRSVNQSAFHMDAFMRSNS